jgi:hypothetical protein
MARTYTVRQVSDAIAAGRQIGTGGSGDVFAVTLDGALVAAKRIPRSAGVGVVDFSALFLREVEQLGRAPRHPNIVSLIGYSTPDPTAAHVYILYELMPLGDLSGHLGPGPGGLSEWDRLQVGGWRGGGGGSGGGRVVDVPVACCFQSYCCGCGFWLCRECVGRCAAV